MKIEFKTDNAAFTDNMEAEIGTILQRIVRNVCHGSTYGLIFDSNGNYIGEWSI